MATQTWPAQGTTIAIDELNTNSYSLINEVISIGHAGGGEMGERDTTTLSGTVKSNAPTIPDNGEVSLSLNFDPTDAVHKFVRDLKDANSLGFNNFKVTLNTTGPATIIFQAWVKEFDGVNADDVDSNLTADVTLRVTGAPTYSPS